MRGDTPGAYHLSSTGRTSAEVGTDFSHQPLLIAIRLPKRHRVGPSASLDEQIRKLFVSYNMMVVGCQIKIRLTLAKIDCRLTIKEKLNRREKS